MCVACLFDLWGYHDSSQLTFFICLGIYLNPSYRVCWCSPNFIAVHATHNSILSSKIISLIALLKEGFNLEVLITVEFHPIIYLISPLFVILVRLKYFIVPPRYLPTSRRQAENSTCYKFLKGIASNFFEKALIFIVSFRFFESYFLKLVAYNEWIRFLFSFNNSSLKERS